MILKSRFGLIVPIFSKSSLFLLRAKHTSSKSKFLLRHVDLIKNLTDCPMLNVVAALKKHLELQMLTEDEITYRYDLLKRYGLSTNKSKLEWLPVLSLHPVTVKNRVMCMEEFGFRRISATSIFRYIIYSRMSINTLIKKSLLPPDIDVVKNMLSFVDLEAPETIENLDNNSPLVAHKKEAVRICLRKYLNFPEEEMLDGGKIMFRQRHKSLRALRDIVNYCQEVLGLSIERISKNPFIFYCDVNNVKKLVDEMKEIGGIDMKHVLRANPKIMSTTYESALEIKKHLQDHNIPDSSVSRCVEIFTLNPETVRERLEELEKIEEFAVCKKHPRVLELVYYQRKAKQRLKLLKEIRVYYASLHTLSSSENTFNKFYEIGAGVPNGNDILCFLQAEMGWQPDEIKPILKKNTFWSYVPLVQVSRTLKYLLESGFSPDNIKKNAILLIYPINSIVEKMKFLEDAEEVESCRDPVTKIIKPELVLPLIVYMIEKDYHFTGEGVWGHDMLMPIKVTKQESSASS